MGGSIVGGHLMGLTDTFGWASSLDVPDSLLDKILTNKYSFAIDCAILMPGFTFVREMHSYD